MQALLKNVYQPLNIFYYSPYLQFSFFFFFKKKCVLLPGLSCIIRSYYPSTRWGVAVVAEPGMPDSQPCAWILGSALNSGTYYHKTSWKPRVLGLWDLKKGLEI